MAKEKVKESKVIEAPKVEEPKAETPKVEKASSARMRLNVVHDGVSYEKGSVVPEGMLEFFKKEGFVE